MNSGRLPDRNIGRAELSALHIDVLETKIRKIDKLTTRGAQRSFETFVTVYFVTMEKAMSSQSPASLSDELAYLPAADLAARIRRRDLSPVEVIDAFIQRIEARNPSPERFRLPRSRRRARKGQGSRESRDGR